MVKKLVVGSILAGVLASSWVGNTYASTETDYDPNSYPVLSIEELRKEQLEMTDEQKIQAYEQAPMHEGETPISSTVDEETGVVIEVFEVKESPIQTFAAGWQIIGYDSWQMYNDSKWRATEKVAKSSGGDFAVRVPKYATNAIQGYDAFIDFQLYEHDPLKNDKVGSVKTFAGTPWKTYDVVWRGIGAWTDGSNGKAEFFVAQKENFRANDSLKVQYLD